MVYLLAATALAFALNAEPAPKPYGPAVETQTSATRIASASETSAAGRPAATVSQPRDDDKNRAYVCVDDNCKTVAPVYNTRTPMEAEARSFRASW